MSQGSRFQIEGYVIVSADGMLSKGDRVMPDELKFEADKAFFSAALDVLLSVAVLFRRMSVPLLASTQHCRPRQIRVIAR